MKNKSDDIFELFDDIFVCDDEGKFEKVPVSYSQITNSEANYSVEKEISLPILILEQIDEVCTLCAMSLTEEEMNQINEQVIMRFPYGKNEKTGLYLKSVSNNLNDESRIIKFRYDLVELE